MAKSVDLFVNAVYVLMRRKQNGHKNFELAIAQACLNYVFDGDVFLEQHWQESGCKFVRNEILPRIKRLNIKDDLVETELLLHIAARLIEADALKYEEARRVSIRWDEVDFASVLGQKLLQEAQSLR